MFEVKFRRETKLVAGREQAFEFFNGLPFNTHRTERDFPERMVEVARRVRQDRARHSGEPQTAQRLAPYLADAQDGLSGSHSGPCARCASTTRSKNKLFKHHAASIRWPFAGFSGLWRRHLMRFMLTRGESCPGLPQLFRRRERFTPITRDAIHYEVTVEDPKVFTLTWKISMP